MKVKQMTETVLTGRRRDRVMADTRNPESNPSQPLLCQIRVEGHLGQHWAEWFDGLAITLEDSGETLLTGPVADQAALHGLLKRVRDLCIPLLSVMCTKAGQAEAAEVNEARRARSREEQ
jgi:hypothetical protein